LTPAVGLSGLSHFPARVQHGAGGVNGVELLSRVDRVMFNSEKASRHDACEISAGKNAERSDQRRMLADCRKVFFKLSGVNP